MWIVVFSITERQHGCLGEPQYLSGTSARPRHRLLLRHAVAGGKLAAGKTSQLCILAGARPSPHSFNPAVLAPRGSHARPNRRRQLFPPNVDACSSEWMKCFTSLVYLPNFREMAKWRRCGRTPARNKAVKCDLGR